MAQAIYRYTDYKGVLRHMIDRNQHRSGYRSRIAEAIQCNKSFLSQVLNGPAHFTLEHAAHLARFWDFNKDDTRYFLDLVMYARAGSVALRELILERIQESRARSKTIPGRVRRKTELEKDFQVQFYSLWYMSAILMSIGTRKTPDEESVSRELGLPLTLVETTVSQLKEMGCLKQSETGVWERSHKNLFLENSPLRSSFLSHWRQQAILSHQKKPDSSLHFTSLYTTSQKKVDEVRAALLTTLENTSESLIDDNKHEDFTICLNLDLFEL